VKRSNYEECIHLLSPRELSDIVTHFLDHVDRNKIENQMDDLLNELATLDMHSLFYCSPKRLESYLQLSSKLHLNFKIIVSCFYLPANSLLGYW
jgi:hypothetical protein